MNIQLDGHQNPSIYIMHTAWCFFIKLIPKCLVIHSSLDQNLNSSQQWVWGESCNFQNTLHTVTTEVSPCFLSLLVPELLQKHSSWPLVSKEVGQ